MDIDKEAFEIFRRAIPHVEVERELARGEDGFIRTKTIPPEGSTAYGPYGMTLGRAKDILENKPHLVKNYNKEQLDYLKRFLEQGALFNKFGINPAWEKANPNKPKAVDTPGWDPKFDYGGRGILDTERDQKLYFEVFDPEVLDTYIKAGGNSMKAAADWHGSTKPNGNKVYQGKIAAKEQEIRSQMAEKIKAFDNDELLNMLADGKIEATPETSFIDWITNLFTRDEKGD